MEKRKNNRLEKTKFYQVRKVIGMMMTGKIKNIEGIFVEGDTTRVLSGTVYTHKDFKLDSQISF